MAVNIIKCQYQPGGNTIALFEAIGAQLAQVNTSFVSAMGASFTGTTLTSQVGYFGGISSEILNSLTGTINSLTTSSMDITTVGHTGYINNLNSDSSIINNLHTNTFFSGTGYVSNLITNSITGSSAYFDSITGSKFFSPLFDTTEITGSSAFFTSITGINIYSGSFTSLTGNYDSLYSQTGHFTTLIASSVLFNSNQETKNYQITDTITGPNAFMNNMTGQKIYCDAITGSSIHFISALTGTNIYTQNVVIPTVTGTSLFSNLITGTNIYSFSQISSNQFSATNIYASSQLISTISVTGSNNIYASQISTSTITGSNVFASTQVASKYLTSNAVNQFTSGNTLVVSGVGILNSTVLDLRRLWTTSVLATRAVATWITETTPDSSGLAKVAWSPELGYFVTPYLSDEGNLAISSNGSSWTSVTTPSIFPNAWQGICYSSEKSEFVISSNGGNYRFLYNSDSALSNWTIVEDPFSAPTVNTSNPVFSPELGEFYIVAQTIGTASSSDGQNWTTYSIPSIVGLPLGALIWSEQLELFCYVGNEFSMISPDIINWTTSSSFLPGNCYGGCWSAELGLFCAVGDNLQTSSDGLTWTTHTSPVSNVIWQDISWSPNLYIFVVVGTNNSYSYSSDGINWTSSSFLINGYGVCWAMELGIFVSTGQGTNMSSALKSTYVKKFYQ